MFLQASFKERKIAWKERKTDEKIGFIYRAENIYKI